MKSCFAACLLSQVIVALDLRNQDGGATCDKSTWTESGPITWVPPGTVLENMIITAPPDTDYALRLTQDNLTLRNVIIYHPANGMGIFGWKPKNLTLENVQVIAYGNEWGAQPCPTRAPMNGYRCVNIELNYAENLKIKNVEVEGGSKGFSIKYSEGAELE